MKMMKLFGLAAAAVCLLALAGCGGQSGGEAGYTKEQVQTILDSGAFTDELDELDCDTACSPKRAVKRVRISRAAATV